MLKKILSGLVLLSLFLSSCAQSDESHQFDLKYYIPKSVGRDDNYPYTKIYKNTNDTNYILKEVYLDEQYKDLLSRYYFYKDVLNGPYATYVSGQVYRKGYYKLGKAHGERITFRNGVIVHKAFFKNDIRTGVWEYFDDKGKLTRKITFDEKGEIEKDENF